jgi:hypothetical protein
MPDAIAVCLLYGDHSALTVRLLQSLSDLLAAKDSQLVEVRFGLNAVAASTRDLVRAWTLQASVPVQLLLADNVGKYPMMRRLLRLPAAATLSSNVKAIWFDDDAYVEPADDWWVRWAAAQQADVTGKIYNWYMQPGQLNWYRDQPWYRHDIPVHRSRNRDAVLFVQGSFWTAGLQYLLDLDWPILQLYHNGGDSLLGLRVRHAGGTLGAFSYGVRVNCRLDGKEDLSVRRGISTRPLGYNYPDEPVVVPDHSFPAQHHVITGDNYEQRQRCLTD